MNALNFVFVPKAFDSKEQLDALYNAHVKRFYKSPDWRKKFQKRFWEHRRTLWHMFVHLPSFLIAKRHYEKASVDLNSSTR